MSNLITNLIGKFEPESNLIVAEPEFEPEPCDIACDILDRMFLLWDKHVQERLQSQEGDHNVCGLQWNLSSL